MRWPENSRSAATPGACGMLALPWHFMHCCWTIAKPPSEAHCAWAAFANTINAQIPEAIAPKRFLMPAPLFLLFLLAEILGEVIDDDVALVVGRLGAHAFHVKHEVLPFVLGMA